MFLQTAAELLWNVDNLCLCLVLDVLNDAAQRQLLKTPDNFLNLLILIDDALQYRNCAEQYELWNPHGEIEINSIYRAAWYILVSYGGDYIAKIKKK